MDYNCDIYKLSHKRAGMCKGYQINFVVLVNNLLCFSNAGLNVVISNPIIICENVVI